MAELIRNLNELSTKIEILKAQGKKIVLADGCFDLLHVGHVRFLRAAKKLGDHLVLALYTDESIKRIRGTRRPLLPLDDRLGVLAAFEMVDFVTSISDDTAESLLTCLKPDFYAHRQGSGMKVDPVMGIQAVALREGEDHSAEKLIQEILQKYGPLKVKP